MPPAAPDGQRRPTLVVVASVLVVAVALGWWWTHGEPAPAPERPGVAAVLVGQGNARMAGGERRELAAGDAVFVGESVETAAGASLSLATNQRGASVMLAPESSVTLRGPATFHLERGRLSAQVAKILMLGLTTPH